MAGIMAVFDFDKTLIETDCDEWVVDELGDKELFDQLCPTMPLNSVMDKMMKELHSRGITMEDIKVVLTKVPIHPGTLRAIKMAHALGCDLRIVSDANLFFITTILDHLGIKDCFSEINTNPCRLDGQGRLRISPYVTSPHGCKLCPANMCKGKIIERIQADESTKIMIYLGDGIGDFCPSLKLKHRDFVMPRKNFPVWDLICENRVLLKAGIHEWANGEEFERLLLGLVDKIMSNPNAAAATVPMAAARETLLPPLRVHQ